MFQFIKSTDGGGELLRITSMYFSFYVSVCQTVCITSIVIVGLILTKLVNLANTEVKIEVLGLSLIIAPPPTCVRSTKIEYSHLQMFFQGKGRSKPKCRSLRLHKLIKGGATSSNPLRERTSEQPSECKMFNMKFMWH